MDAIRGAEAASEAVTLFVDGHEPGSLRVLEVDGVETMSKPYRFEIRAELSRHAAGLAQLSNAEAAIRVAGAPDRVVRGIITSARMVSRGDLPPFVRLTLAPRLVRLRRRRNRRVFHDLTAVDMVSTLLGEHGAPCRWSLHRSYRTRSHTVQYDETDFAFVRRLLADEGIFYSFEAEDETTPETIVFGDQARTYREIAGDSSLRYIASATGAGALHEGHRAAFAFELSETPRSRSVLTRGYDYQRPLAELASQAPGARAAHRAEDRIYQHDPAYEGQWDEPDDAGTRLEQERRASTLGRGQSHCANLTPARRFRLTDHPLDAANGEYVVTEVRHRARGQAGEGELVYENDFQAVPSSVSFRPKAPARILRQVVETATVVGPEGRETYTDNLGRVKVKFHWDLAAAGEASSCWVRVVQPWAGGGYGAWFLPRVGQEVLVSFVGGDTDHPVVVGGLYNSAQNTPFPLPQDAEKSGIVTRSTPGGVGQSELSFDDSAGAEVVLLRSHKNLALGSGQDCTVTTGGDLRGRISGDLVFDADRDFSLKSDLLCSIHAGGPLKTTSGGPMLVQGGGNRVTHIAGNDDSRVGGGLTQTAATFAHLVVGDAETAGSRLVSARGKYRVQAYEGIELGSHASITLSCGDSKISILPDKILVESPRILFQAKEELLASAREAKSFVRLDEAAAIGGGTVLASSGGARLYLDADAYLEGALVKLNCDKSPDAGVELEGAEEEEGEITFRLAQPPDPAGGIVTLVIATPSGEVVERPVGAGGLVTLKGKKGDRFSVIDVRQGGKSLSATKVST